jgi:hypothetical protein
MDTPLAQMPLERLETDIVRLGADLTARLGQWLALVAEFDRREAARRWGFRSTSDWLAWRCGISARAARDHVRVARGLADRPLIRAALLSGELSYSKVRALTRAPGSEDEADLVARARSSTASELERFVGRLRTAPSANVDVANAAHARRYVDWGWDEDGSLWFRGRLPADDGAAFIEAVEAAAAAVHPPADGESGHGDDDGRDHEHDHDEDGDREPPPRAPLGARRADALAEIVLSGCPRAQVVLHVDGPALACTATGDAERAGDTCEIEAGPAVPSETARRLACDADLMLARPAAGRTLDLGRRQRVVSPALRTALERRDRGCRFPGCDRRHDLHAHHVHHWAHGGSTDRRNLVLLCRFHHRMVHEEGFTVAGAVGERFVFWRPDGVPVPQVPETPTRFTATAQPPPPATLVAA